MALYSSELQLNKGNSSDSGFTLTISDGFVSSKIYDKRVDFDIVKFPFLDGDISRATSYRGLYITAYSVC